MRSIKTALTATAVAGLMLSNVAYASDTRSASALPGVTTVAMQGVYDDDDDGSPSAIFLGVAALAALALGIFVLADGDDDIDDFDLNDTVG